MDSRHPGSLPALHSVAADQLHAFLFIGFLNSPISPIPPHLFPISLCFPPYPPLSPFPPFFLGPGALWVRSRGFTRGGGGGAYPHCHQMMTQAKPEGPWESRESPQKVDFFQQACDGVKMAKSSPVEPHSRPQKYQDQVAGNVPTRFYRFGISGVHKWGWF